MQLGIDRFICEHMWKPGLEGKRVALLGHMASVSSELKSSLELISTQTPLQLNCLFSPQHGFAPTEQANMQTTEDSSFNHIPLFSLYSKKTRRLSPKMLAHFDVLLVDLQDVGCRVYTYLSTLLYVLEDCTTAGKEVWILDRPNPAGRDIEGFILHPGFKSFVGPATIPLRHGLTLAELALWHCKQKNLVHPVIVKMKGYQIQKHPWPGSLHWVLPSPNIPDPECAHHYSGSVLLEGTSLSEGRGTTLPFKQIGAPGMKTRLILQTMQKMAPQWLDSCYLKEEQFKPTFDKHQKKICSGLRIYLKNPKTKPFRGVRIIALFLKAVYKTHPECPLFIPPPYEYEYKKSPFDIIAGTNFLRSWILDKTRTIKELDNVLTKEETLWEEERKDFLLY